MIVDKAVQTPYGFVYITTNLINGKRYIGKRKFSDNWKSYLGSGIRLKEAIKKYGRNNFVKVIVDVGYSDEELSEKEMNLISFLMPTTIEIIITYQKVDALRVKVEAKHIGMGNIFQKILSKRLI